MLHSKLPWRYKLPKLVVHEFLMSDVEDVALYAAEPLCKWENTEQGQWVMQNAVTTPTWNTIQDFSTYSVRIRIIAELSEQDATYFLLKYKTT